MINKKLLLLLLGGSLLNAQTINETNAAAKVSGKTGINTKVPTRTLTVENTTANQGKPVLRLVNTPKFSSNVGSAMDADLGGNTQSTTSYFDYKPLLVNSVGDVYQGVPITNNTGIITLSIENVDQDYVSNFNTGIDFDKYAVVILSYTFMVPGVENNKVAMLVASNELPNVYMGGNKTLTKQAAPTVYLFQDGNKWAIYADYPDMGVQRFTKNNTGHGTSYNVNGRWIINLLVGKRELFNFARLSYDQQGGNQGNGMTNGTYNAAMTQFLQKLD